MKNNTPDTSRSVRFLLTLSVLPMLVLTGCCSGRMALNYGLHAQAKPDEAVMASVATPPHDVTPQRHARLELTSSHRNLGSELAVHSAETVTGAEDESFTPADGPDGTR